MVFPPIVKQEIENLAGAVGDAVSDGIDAVGDFVGGLVGGGGGSPPENGSAAGGGVALCTAPDVCFTPIGGTPVPLPYMITAQMSAQASYTGTVGHDGDTTQNMSLSISNCVGDEAGTLGGIISGVNLDVCTPLASSGSTSSEGAANVRDGDACHMNKENTVGAMLIGGGASIPPGFTDLLYDPEELESMMAEYPGLDEDLKNGVPGAAERLQEAGEKAGGFFNNLWDKAKDAANAAMDHVVDTAGAASEALVALNEEYNLVTRAIGGLQVVSGALMASAGATMAASGAALTGTGLGAPLGVLLMGGGAALAVMGADEIAHGAATVITGEEHKTLTTQAFEHLAKSIGLPEEAGIIGELLVGFGLDNMARVGAKYTDDFIEMIEAFVKKCAGKSNPVDPSDGTVFVSEVDAMIPGSLPFNLSRVHRGSVSKNSLFGPLWQDPFGAFVELEADGTIAYHTAFCDVVWFKDPGKDHKPSYNAQAQWCHLFRVEGTYYIRHFDGNIHEFGVKHGQRRFLSQISNRAENNLRFEYGGEKDHKTGLNALSCIRSSDGHHANLAVKNGLLTSVDLVDEKGATRSLAKYSYDDKRRLTSATDIAGKTETFTYTPQHRLEAHVTTHPLAFIART